MFCGKMKVSNSIFSIVIYIIVINAVGKGAILLKDYPHVESGVTAESNTSQIIPETHEIKINEKNINNTEVISYASNTTQTNSTDQPIDTEVKDLLNNEDRKQIPNTELITTNNQFNTNNNIHPIEVNNYVELIENGDNSEDVLRHHLNEDDENVPKDNGVSTQTLTIACTVTILVVLCYVVLLSWRKYLEKRYGSRTMLVTSEEFYDPNDLKNFSI